MSECDSNHDSTSFRANRTWARMFADALRGVRIAFRGEVNFVIHLAAAGLAVALGVWVDLNLGGWAVLGLCISVVFTAEMCNTAIEHLARAVTREAHPEVRDALDIAGGAVLVAALGAAVVGTAVLISAAMTELH